MVELRWVYFLYKFCIVSLCSIGKFDHFSLIGQNWSFLYIELFFSFLNPGMLNV